MVHLCDVASTAVDNLEFMFQARFESLILLNRRLKDDVAKKKYDHRRFVDLPTLLRSLTFLLMVLVRAHSKFQIFARTKFSIHG